MTRPTAAVSWSGGKDSCAALHRIHDQYHVTSMVTMFDEDAARSRSHGLRPAVVAAQAARLGLTQFIGRCTWPTYNDVFRRTLDEVAASGVTHRHLLQSAAASRCVPLMAGMTRRRASSRLILWPIADRRRRAASCRR